MDKRLWRDGALPPEIWPALPFLLRPIVVPFPENFGEPPEPLQQIEGHQIVTDISIGISVAPMDAVESDGLLRNADMALYDAKADGRGTFQFFEPQMNTPMRVRRELEMDLRKALATEQFELHYQPLVVLKTNDVNAFEALLRWNHPTRGMISPADFIPIAEETGLIVPLGEWVLKTACSEAAD